MSVNPERMRHRRIYEAIKRVGFSPAYASTVLIECRRKKLAATSIVKLAVKNRHRRT